MFPARVERWRNLVEQESGLPTDVVLAVIYNESRGNAGQIAGERTKTCVNLPLRAGGQHWSCYALGLMQVIPANIKDWSIGHPTAYYEDMTGKSSAAAALQIRIGSWVLRANLNLLNLYDPIVFPWPSGELTGDQMLIGLMCYLWGAKRVKPYLDELRKIGAPLTFGELARRWPEMGKPSKNRPVKYATKINNYVSKWGAGSLVETPIKKPAGKDAGVGALLLVGLAAWALGGD